jgi:glycosyltransferase involved in cell wall biosynthesis
MMPRFSIYIPVRNRPELLAETLDAIQAQSWQDWECWVVDDASSDATFDVIQAYARQDKRFHGLRHLTPQGDAAASNTALQHLRGLYAARMDSDDLPLPDWLATGMDFARHFQGVAFGCQAELFGAVADLRMPKPKETDPLRWQAWSLFNDENYHSGLMFRRDVQQATVLSYRALTVNSDWDFIHRLARHGAVANLPDTLVRIRRHADNSTRAVVMREHRDSVSVAIRRSLLVERLGITPDDEAMLLHCTAYPAPYWQFADQAYVWLRRDDYLQRLTAWLQQLLAANETQGHPYDPAVLRSVLLDELLPGTTAQWRALPTTPPTPFKMDWLPD